MSDDIGSGDTVRGRLTRSVKSALLETMRKTGDKPARAAAPIARAGRHDISFESLPAYQQLRTQRAIARRAGDRFPVLSGP